ncbi:thioesterase family protein [Lactococcus nasutitermitis]|uniref:Thioesterase family protein n=1 Tax=Lactococcus nasutitermitis TaxID=1652957 RepID=A0ABV9JBH2_9LACT|nr:thioesterase family protein [Lactococcus nasutitermitis]
MSEIKIGSRGTAETTVDATNTALAVGSGSLPVFATPMMIALMEKAACASLAPFLENGQTTVGTQMSVSHELASPVGSQIVAIAIVTALDRRRIDFEVQATANGKIIGKGTHSRFIVDSQKFLDKLI